MAVEWVGSSVCALAADLVAYLVAFVALGKVDWLE